MTNIIRSLACFALIGASTLPAQAEPTPETQAAEIEQAEGACGPVNGLSFVCGLHKPEDLVSIPGTRWLVASGVDPAASLDLIDTDAKSAKPLYTAAAEQIRPDAKRFPGCPAAPARTGFAPHGLSLVPAGPKGLFRLYVVSHLSLEGVHVFDLDARADTPSIAWAGCMPLPKGMTANAVVGLRDGSVLATVRGDIVAEGPAKSASGITMGAVVRWMPAGKGFQQLVGTEMYGTNGIEMSRDESEFYVVSTDAGSVTAFSLADTAKPLRRSTAPLTTLDNLHWVDGRLYAAGKMADEPACGGTRQDVIDSGKGIHDCIRGYAAVELDPATMKWRVIAYGEPNPVFDGIATAIPVGDTLWLSSFLMDRVAYRPLPGAR